MSNHHKHPREGHDHKHPHEKHGRKLHKDWRLWLAVVLMLLCMIIYISTMDLGFAPIPQPAGNPPSAGGR